MAASNPSGEMQFWLNGQPFSAVQKNETDAGEMRFWFKGQPYSYIFPPVSLYTRQVLGSLPATSSPLNTNYTSQDVTDTSSSNDVRVGITGVGYLLHQFKKQNSNNTQTITVSVELQTTLAPSTKTVYLQIYNVSAKSWETLASNNSASINTDFTLSGTQTTSLANYYDEFYTVSFRVYQGVV